MFKVFMAQAKDVIPLFITTPFLVISLAYPLSFLIKEGINNEENKENYK